MADEIIEEFLVESAEGLERIEQDLVELEEDPGSREVVDRIFRDVHTIKGVCGFLGFGNLEGVTHAAESLLSTLRSGELEVSAEIISALLTTVDAIRAMIARVEATERDGDDGHPALVERLQALQRGPQSDDASPHADPAPGATAQASPDPAPQVERPASEPARHAKDPESGAGEPPHAEPGRPLGQILVERGTDPEHVSAALETQQRGDPRRVGEILVRRNQASAQEVAEAVEEQRAARGAKDTTIRVSVDLLDKLMNLVGELVLVRNQILQSTLSTEDAGLGRNAQRLNLVTSELQEGVMKTRMQPIGTIWGKLPRVVRDLAYACRKEMRLEMEGRETELDKTIIEAIKDPLTHLVRNACDHGMEPPEVRERLGKPREGVLRLRAFHEGGQVIIEVADDGKGIDADAIRHKAVERGLLGAGQAERLSEREALHLIFLPGFSTAQQVTNVSGRGVGMDVVKTNIERIGGTIDVSSTLGAGTTIRVKIPLTLAIIPALIVRCGGDPYAIPQVSLLELVLLEGDETQKVETVNGTPVYRLRGKLLPLVFLSEQLGLGPRPPARDGEPEALNIVVLQADGQAFGLVVEGVRDTEEIVVKPLGKELKSLGAYAGATVMGDGAVALILDVLGLAKLASLVTEGARAASAEEGPTDRALDKSQALLLFESESVAPLAVELSRIDRLEEFAPARVEHTGTRDVVQYRDEIMPVVHLSSALYGRPLEQARRRDDDESYQVLVIRRGDMTYGLVVGRLIDIVDTAAKLRPVGRRDGIRGTAVVQGRVVELLDIDAILARAVPEAWTEGQIGEGG